MPALMQNEGHMNAVKLWSRRALGLTGLAYTFTWRLPQHGVKVTLLAPGGTKTNIATPKHEGYMEPEAIADAIVYITENRGAAWVRDLSVLPLGF